MADNKDFWKDLLGDEYDESLYDSVTPDVPAETPTKEYTYEEARAVLAEKSRTGFRTEVKAILTGHGVTQLSDVRDPKVLAAIVAEAEEIKVG